MLQAFVFERVGVVVGDLYFLDPQPAKGQEGPEHGVRLELRVIDRGELKGSIYSATPIEVGLPIWRVDLLESVEGKPGSYNRTHHHPAFFPGSWDPQPRKFLRELSGDPLGWLGEQLADLPGILERAERHLGVKLRHRLVRRMPRRMLVSAGDIGFALDGHECPCCANVTRIERRRNPATTGGHQGGRRLWNWD